MLFSCTTVSHADLYLPLIHLPQHFRYKNLQPERVPLVHLGMCNIWRHGLTYPSAFPPIPTVDAKTCHRQPYLIYLPKRRFCLLPVGPREHISETRPALTFSASVSRLVRVRWAVTIWPASTPAYKSFARRARLCREQQNRSVLSLFEQLHLPSQTTPPSSHTVSQSPRSCPSPRETPARSLWQAYSQVMTRPNQSVQ